jgi:hypothetical protein
MLSMPAPRLQLLFCSFFLFQQNVFCSSFFCSQLQIVVYLIYSSDDGSQNAKRKKCVQGGMGFSMEWGVVNSRKKTCVVSRYVYVVGVCVHS